MCDVMRVRRAWGPRPTGLAEPAGLQQQCPAAQQLKASMLEVPSPQMLFPHPGYLPTHPQGQPLTPVPCVTQAFSFQGAYHTHMHTHAHMHTHTHTHTRTQSARQADALSLPQQWPTTALQGPRARLHIKARMRAPRSETAQLPGSAHLGARGCGHAQRLRLRKPQATAALTSQTQLACRPRLAAGRCAAAVVLAGPA